MVFDIYLYILRIDSIFNFVHYTTADYKTDLDVFFAFDISDRSTNSRWTRSNNFHFSVEKVCIVLFE